MARKREAGAVQVAAIGDGRRPRVVVIGGGFAGLAAAKKLGTLPVDVTLIDKSNHHTFQPLLYQVALAVLSPADIATPIRAVLRNERNVDVLMDEVRGFDTERRRLSLASGAEMQYDYLIVASGSTHSYFGHDEWEKSAPGLKSIEDATEIRRRVLLAFELAERQVVETGSHPPLNFLVVGGGPTGVELAGAIAEISKYFLDKDFRHIDPSKAKTLLIEGGPRILPSYPEDLSQMAVRQLQHLGVEVRTGKQVEDVRDSYVVLQGGERIDSIVTLWGAGVAASPLGKLLGVETDKRGAVMVNATLNPAGHPEIFVCGDLAHFEQDGKQVPGVAQPAMQMGTHAARMIRQDLRRLPRTRFRYFDKGDMATIGRFSAVADIKWPFKAHWGGLPAWMTWLLVHLVFIIGFRNRVAVLFQWGWTYVFYARGARLITGNSVLPGWKDQPGVVIDRTFPALQNGRGAQSPGAEYGLTQI
jgi:NADH dehydrogenase